MRHVLTTDRLTLRPVAAADHSALLAHWTEPHAFRFLFDGSVPTAAEVTTVIRDSERTFADAGFGLWLIHPSRATGLLGAAGLRPLDDLGLEVYYSLAHGREGRGYATEAARAVVDYALGRLGLPEVLAEIDEGNTASVAVIERLGMTPFAVVEGILGPMTRYRGNQRSGRPTT